MDPRLWLTHSFRPKQMRWDTFLAIVYIQTHLATLLQTQTIILWSQTLF
jgi:hypothetical protein